MEYINLLGAEDVQKAGRNMISAAQAMNQSLSYLDEILHRNQIFMDDWLERFTKAMKPETDIKQGF